MSGLASVVGRLLDALLSTIGWLIVAFLLLVAAMRLFAWDEVHFFVFMDSLNGVLYAPVIVVFLVSLGRRRWRLVIASGVVIAAMLSFVLPEVFASATVPAWTRHAMHFTLFDGNVDSSNRSMAGYAKDIEQLHPDLVTFEEATSFDGAQLRADGAFASLPHQFEVYRFDPWGFVIASRYRFTNISVHDGGGLPFLVQGVLHLPTGPISLWVVHTLAPVSSVSIWEHDLATVAADYRQQHPKRLLVVGDFNATWGNRGFHDIVASGLTDAAAARGRPFDMTWSQQMGIVPPLIRIDHVLTGPGVVATSISTRNGPGSDHRALVATIAVRR